MLVSDLFRRLSLGELSNLSIGNDGAGTIKDAAKPKLILHANDSLRALYSRFVLKEKALFIETRIGQTIYELDAANTVSAVAAGGTGDPYIIDTVLTPFLDDVVKVMSAYSSDNVPLVINQSNNPLSIYTPSPDSVQIPSDIGDGKTVALTYQAYHSDLVDDDETQVIILPQVLEPALTSHIAFQIYDNMNTGESQANADRFIGRYENICARVEHSDLMNAGLSDFATKFQKNGWV